MVVVLVISEHVQHLLQSKGSGGWELPCMSWPWPPFLHHRTRTLSTCRFPNAPVSFFRSLPAPLFPPARSLPRPTCSTANRLFSSSTRLSSSRYSVTRVYSACGTVGGGKRGLLTRADTGYLTPFGHWCCNLNYAARLSYTTCNLPSPYLKAVRRMPEELRGAQHTSLHSGRDRTWRLRETPCRQLTADTADA